METLILNRIEISSPSFKEGENIPTKHTCDGENISPALEIGALPEGVLSLALIADDPDAPAGTWTHWLMWDIPPLNGIPEGAAPGILGRNDFNQTNYGGPCPPLGTHRYFFRMYALNCTLNLPEGSTKDELLEAMRNHVLASGELMGVYSR
ncbi:YbhB/YbcL family Raf kinase inhibitor-like protein [Pontibacter oryzae]|uniref:YbhB/YbcL family Raf kinase inhibitor-like protein n=1 Tax=Pontibacter oryzae TaxID=2304593 RepID=UPI0018F3E433|nr:YbhB/YbcL family Raf kinase inhibitor-like protein [Pontibacter oryzae]